MNLHNAASRSREHVSTRGETRRTYAPHRRRLSVRLNVPPLRPFSKSSRVPSRSAVRGWCQLNLSCNYGHARGLTTPIHA